MHRIPKRPVIEVSDRGCGVVSHASFRLLAYLADRSEVTGGFGEVLVDLAVMLADGGTAISDLAVLPEQPILFGSVTSTATA